MRNQREPNQTKMKEYETYAYSSSGTWVFSHWINQTKPNQTKPNQNKTNQTKTWREKPAIHLGKNVAHYIWRNSHYSYCSFLIINYSSRKLAFKYWAQHRIWYRKYNKLRIYLCLCGTFVCMYASLPWVFMYVESQDSL